MVNQYKCLETAAKEPVSSATAAATWSGIIITVKPEFLASTNFRQNTVREHSRLQFFASAQVVKKKIQTRTNITLLYIPEMNIAGKMF